jgi:SAM-dependent methyltransferase
MLRPVSTKSLTDIISEWDALAPIRRSQITTGKDITYNRVLIPNLVDLVEPLAPSKLLDAGCGIGTLTSRLTAVTKNIVGVDPSGNSIEIARSLNDPSTLFVQGTIEQFATTSNTRFDVVVANMVLMDTLSLGDFLLACRKLLNSDGAFVFSITHPCFWPDYYGYGKAEWFRYENEIIIESPFRISNDRESSLVSTHVHRPLSAYLNGFRTADLALKKVQEPMPPTDVDPQYLADWKRPRYLIGLCRPISRS